MTKRSWNILSGIVLVVVALLVFNRNSIVSLFTPQDQREINVRKISSYKLASLRSADSIYASEDRYYFYYNDRVTCYGLDGKKIWHKDFENDVSFLDTQSGVLIAEKSVGNIYLFDENGELQKSILGLGEINFAEFGLDGRCVVRLNNNRTIMTYDSKMKLISEFTIDEGTIIEHNSNFDTDRIALLILRDVNGDVSSYVQIIDMDGTVIHEKSYNEKLLAILSNYDGYLFLYQNKVTLYDSKLREQKRKKVKINDIRYFNFSPNVIIILNDESRNKIENNYYFKTYDINENKIGINAEIDVKYNKIIFKDGIFAAIVDNRIDVYNQSGTLIHSKEQKSQVVNLYILDENHLLVLEENLLTLYEIIN